ncbi:unnamed protein product [Tuber aestivum]|uniref:Uncharacterized protein n=1 Tax=Tuber aestivum TaxID=59557 RepID=A0A292Q092_9PEZI|nr:unnamed protein product [Tuber aestivum]
MLYGRSGIGIGSIRKAPETGQHASPRCGREHSPSIPQSGNMQHSECFTNAIGALPGTSNPMKGISPHRISARPITRSAISIPSRTPLQKSMPPQENHRLGSKSLHTANYGPAIPFYLLSCDGGGQQQLSLRYGQSPHQNPAQAFVKSGELPTRDTLNSWPQAKELKRSLGFPAAAPFKHVAPTCGAVEKTVCFVGDVKGLDKGPQACAYTRAGRAEGMNSFGDRIAPNDIVDVATARVMSGEAPDGLIAPSYTSRAFDILKKKGGTYTV